MGRGARGYLSYRCKLPLEGGGGCLRYAPGAGVCVEVSPDSSGAGEPDAPRASNASIASIAGKGGEGGIIFIGNR